MTNVHVESWGCRKQALVITSSTGCSLECAKIDGRENLRYHEWPKTELPKTALWGYRIKNSHHWPKQVGTDVIWSVWGKNWKMSRCMCAKLLQLQLHSTLCNPMDCSPQAPLSLGFSRQEYWGRLPCPSPGDLPDPGIKRVSPLAPALQADSLPLSHRKVQVAAW